MFLFSEHDLNWEQFWTGLYNPQEKECYDSGCVNKLKWLSDGSNLLSWPDPSHELYFNEGEYCGRYRSDKINDKSCNQYYYYICEFKCPATTTTTTTTTTTGMISRVLGWNLSSFLEKSTKSVVYVSSCNGTKCILYLWAMDSSSQFQVNAPWCKGFVINFVSCCSSWIHNKLWVPPIQTGRTELISLFNL